LSLVSKSVSGCGKRHKGAKTVRKRAQKRIMATKLKTTGLFLAKYSLFI
jgi:hypothetical protein